MLRLHRMYFKTLLQHASNMLKYTHTHTHIHTEALNGHGGGKKFVWEDIYLFFNVLHVFSYKTLHSLAKIFAFSRKTS